LSLINQTGSAAEDVVRRVFDVVVASVGLFVTVPLLIVVAMLVGFSSPGGVIYRSRRIGRGGKPFFMYKFRTMVSDADRNGSLVTCRNDPRVTRVGRWLRRSKLDELPEMWNVIRGDMSIVGPRPENPQAVARFSASQRALLEVRPGITSPATIKYRHEENMLADPETEYLALMQDKLALDLDYIARRSFASDMKIILMTAAALVR
jgi:lipopolysaccharide/colanic/teichoic acid biosynthesis glycosyltransferase